MAASEELSWALRAVRGIQLSLNAGAVFADGEALAPEPDVSAAKRSAPTVFVSWAHSHASWTQTQTSDWESQVAEFAATLRALGIDADIDLFHLDETVDWTRFGPRGVQAARSVIVVMSRAWAERWSGTNSPREGAGAAAEADTLRGLFATDQAEWQRRLVIAMFPDVETDVVPPDLQRATRVSVDPSDPDSYESLVRILTGQPRYPKPPLGTVPSLGAVGVLSGGRLRELRERLAVTEREMSKLARSKAGPENREAAKEDLTLRESALRGFIDAALKQDD